MRFGCLFSTESIPSDRSTQLASGCFVSIIGGHWPLTGCNFEFLNHSANSIFFCCIALNEWDHLVFPRTSSPWDSEVQSDMRCAGVNTDNTLPCAKRVYDFLHVFLWSNQNRWKIKHKKSIFQGLNTCFNDYTSGLPVKALKKWDLSVIFICWKSNKKGVLSGT